MEKEYHDASRMTAWQTTIGLATLLDGYYDDETNPATEKYTITMKKLSTKYAYLPYCIDPYSIDAKGDIDFEEDFFITKDKGTKTIEVSACPGFSMVVWKRLALSRSSLLRSTMISMRHTIIM